MLNWIKKFFGFSVKPIPEAPKKSYPEPIQDVLDGAGLVNQVPEKKGRNKRSGQPPRR